MEEIKFFAYIKDNKIDGIGECQCLNEEIINAEITEEIYNNIDHYIWNGTDVAANPNYEKEQEEKEQERINNLTMTALDFIGVLEKFGLDYYTEIKPFLETHPNLDKQLKYCQNVWCGVAKQVFANPITIGNITITSEMVEQAFKDKTGENDEN